MERNELLEKLHSIIFMASLTALTSENCLEVEVITGDGVDYSWIGYDEWNLYALHGIEQKKWNNIREKLNAGNLSKNDIVDTDLELLVGDRCEENGFDYCRFFRTLNDFSTTCPEEFFCKFTKEVPVFFETETEFANSQKEAYKGCVKPWDEMETDELEHWLEVYENCDSIPYCRFDD